MPKVEEWLNHTMADSTGFYPVQLMFSESRPDLFQAFLKKDVDQLPSDGILSDKVLQIYLRMKLKAERRNKSRKRG